MWTKQIQGHVLGSFFYGYLVSQVPAGILAQRYSGKWVFTAFYALSTVGTLITPLAARVHFGLLIVVRALVGLGSVSACVASVIDAVFFFLFSFISYCLGSFQTSMILRFFNPR